MYTNLRLRLNFSSIGLSLVSLSLAACFSSGNAQQPSSSTSPQYEDFVRTEKLEPIPVAPNFLSIGPVATNLWTFNALFLDDPVLKTPAFYVTSFVEGSSPRHGQLIRLDYLHKRAKSWTIPAGIGAWGIIKGQDGNLYMGTYGEAMLLCFNPRTEQWIPIPQAPEPFRKQENIITDLVQAPDGNIYYGTYPDAHLVRYDPHRGTVTDLGKAGDENYLRWLAVTHRGIILSGMGSRHGRIITYDPQTRFFQTITPPKDQTRSFFQAPGNGP